MSYDAFMIDIFLPGAAVVAVVSAWIIWRLATRAPRGIGVTALIAVAAIVLPVMLGALYVLANILMRGGAVTGNLASFMFEGGIELAVPGAPVALIALIIARIKSRKSVEA